MDKNILIINAHSSKNKGDAAIIISMVQSILKFTPSAKITISSRYPEDDDIYKELGCEVVEHLTRYPSQGMSKIQRIKFIKNELNGVKKFFKSGIIPEDRNSSIFKALEKSDIVVSCGGGFLYSHPKYHIEASLIMHLSQIYFASKKKKVLLYSQSIGPFRSLASQKLANWVLNKADTITIREELSRGFLNDIGVNNVEVVGDSAFTMEMHKPVSDIDSFNIDESAFNIGVTVRQWEFPGKENRDSLYQEYINSVAGSIELLIKNYNSKVYLVPQVTGPTQIEDDRVANKHIWDKLKDDVKVNVDFLTNDYTPQELKYIYSKFDMFIGTRMHSNIFSLSSHVPTVAISYEPKTAGIMEMLGLPEYVIDINEISLDSLNQAVKKCYTNRFEYSEYLHAEIPKMKERAEIPAIKINQIIN